MPRCRQRRVPRFIGRLPRSPLLLLLLPSAMVAATAAALAAAFAASLAASLATDRERVASCDQRWRREGAKNLCLRKGSNETCCFFVLHAPLGGALCEGGVRMHIHTRI